MRVKEGVNICADTSVQEGFPKVLSFHRSSKNVILSKVHFFRPLKKDL